MTQGKKQQREASQCVLRTASGGGVSHGGMSHGGARCGGANRGGAGRGGASRGGASCGIESSFAHHCSTSLDLLASKLKPWVNYHQGRLAKSLISRATVGRLEAP